MKDSIEQDLERLDVAAETRDLKTFTALSDSLVSKWKAGDAQELPRVLLAVCGKLSSYDFQPAAQRYAALKSYASTAVFETKPSVENAFRFLDFLSVASRQTGWEKGAGFDTERKQLADAWLSSWSRLEAARIPGFDFTDVPELNVAPQGMRSGTASEEIKDPAVRKEYEEALRLNDEKAKRYNEQRMLHYLARDYEPRLVTFLAAAYSLPEQDTAQLKELFALYHTDQALQQQILDAVKHP